MIRQRLLITGMVQGVGFRPFAWRRATRLGLTGYVENTSAGVVVEIQGSAAAVAAFADGLVAAAPPLAVIEQVMAKDIPPLTADGAPGLFRILASAGGAAPHTLVPPDIATCVACLAELRDPTNRRHGHAFITCTDCGPRFTIIESLPYDRPATTMRSFAMCSACGLEYADPADRRFHAQPIACPACGPIAWFTAAGHTRAAPPIRHPPIAQSTATAIAAARRVLAAGGILAVKGLGGFHLACDATHAAAVALIRTRKHRPTKPLAVMAADLGAARRMAVIDEQEARLLTGPERPIVVVRKRPGGMLAEAVAPGSDFLGVMLPSAPLQHLLAEGLPPLVMTSGNLADEPIASDNAEAVGRLGGLADGFLLHDRDIHAPCDDSVVRCVAGASLPIRLARGHAPLPIRLATPGPSILAVGGELKAALCLAVGDRAIMSQHVGDMGSLETLAAIERAAEHLLRLFAATPAAVVADLHPGYLSAEWAKRFAAARGIPLVRVQHHEAHVAALITEHFGRATPPPAAGACLVACFDGTGYAPGDRDTGGGMIRGGEFFVVSAAGMRHAAHLETFPLPGGDAAIRQPWRTAVAMLHAAGIPWDHRLAPVEAAEATLRIQLDRGLGCVPTASPTTSMGRLFDGVAAIVGGPPTVTFEAEAALVLESWAMRSGAEDDGRYAFAVRKPTAAAPLVIDWRGLFARIVQDVLAGEDRGRIAAGFHHAVVRLIDEVRQSLSPAAVTVGLTGGVFQNALLVEGVLARLHGAGCHVLLHHAVPPNDGGLALGQAALARGCDLVATT
jgi:hydrogenase maturation protein HypF